MVSAHHVNHEYSPFSALYNVKIRNKITVNEADMDVLNTSTCYDKNVSTLPTKTFRHVPPITTSRKAISQSEEKKKGIKSDSTYCITSYDWNDTKDGSDNDSLLTVKISKKKSTKNQKNSMEKQSVTKKKLNKNNLYYVERKESSLNKQNFLLPKKKKQISIECRPYTKRNERRQLEKVPSRFVENQKHLKKAEGKDENHSEDGESVYSFQRPLSNKKTTKSKNSSQMTKTGLTTYMNTNYTLDSIEPGTTSLNTFDRDISQCESLSEDRIFQRLGRFQTLHSTCLPETGTAFEDSIVIENSRNEEILPNNACATVSSTDPTVVKPRDCTFWKKWFALRGWSTDLDAPTTEEGTFDHFQSFPSHLTKETADGMSFGSISNVSHALLKSGSKGTFAKNVEVSQENSIEKNQSHNHEENSNRRPERIAAQLRSYVTLLNSPSRTKDLKKLECEELDSNIKLENIQNDFLEEREKSTSTSYVLEKTTQENDGDGCSTNCQDVLEILNEEKEGETFKKLTSEELKTDGSFYVLQDEKKTCSLLHAKNMMDSNENEALEKEKKPSLDSKQSIILNDIKNKMNTIQNSNDGDKVLPKVYSCLCSKSSHGESSSIHEDKFIEHECESFRHNPSNDPTTSTYDDASVKTIIFGSEEANSNKNENFLKIESKIESRALLTKQLTLNGPLLLSHISKDKSYRFISAHSVTVPRFYSKSVLIQFSEQLEKNKINPLFLKLYSDGIEDIHLTQWLALDTRGLRKVTCRYIKAMGWTFKIIFLWSLASMLLVFTVSTVQTKESTSFLIMYWTLCVFYFIISLFFLMGPVKPTCEIYKKSWMFLMNQQLVIKCFSHVSFRKIITSYHSQLDDFTVASFYSTPRFHNKRLFQSLLLISYSILFLIFFIIIKIINMTTGTTFRKMDFGINFVLTWFVGIFSLIYTLNLYSIEEFSESSKLLAINKILALVETFNCSAFLNTTLKNHQTFTIDNSSDQIRLQSHYDIHQFQLKQLFEKTTNTSLNDSWSILSSPYMKQYPLWKFFFGGIVILWRKDQELNETPGILFLQLQKKKKSYVSLTNLSNWSFAIVIYNASKQKSRWKKSSQTTEIVINYLTEITPLKNIESGIVLLKLIGLSHTKIHKGCLKKTIPNVKHIFIHISIHEACMFCQAFSYLTSKLEP